MCCNCSALQCADLEQKPTKTKIIHRHTQLEANENHLNTEKSISLFLFSILSFNEQQKQQLAQ